MLKKHPLFSLPVFLFSCSLLISGCDLFDDDPDDQPKEPQSPKLELTFKNQVDGLSLQFDTLIYTNAAGNLYSIEKLRYFISNFTFYDDAGQVTYKIDSVLYIDARDTNTQTFSFSPFTIAHHHYFTFTFGLDSAHNFTESLPRTDPYPEMDWSPTLGGGYHFLMLEGRYRQTAGTLSGYNTHFGSRSHVRQFNHFEFSCLQAPIHKSVLKGSELHVEIIMNVNNWYKNPIYDFNTYNLSIMNDSTAQDLLKQNGKNDVFSKGTVEVHGTITDDHEH